MGMNIKNEEAHMLASEISKITGENLTMVVLESLKQRYATLQKPEQNGLDKARRAMQIAKSCSTQMNEKTKTLDVNLFLYDEKGLPQ